MEKVEILLMKIFKVGVVGESGDSGVFSNRLFFEGQGNFLRSLTFPTTATFLIKGFLKTSPDF